MLKKSLPIVMILALIVFAYLIGINLQTAISNQPITIMETTVAPIPTLNPESVAIGKRVYAQYCADCHGASLQGVPNWKERQPDDSFLPPPHNSSGHTWHHADPLLIEIITNGGDPDLYDTKMPGFGKQLTEEEISAVLDYIKSSWWQDERELQWWVTVMEK